MKTDSIQLKTKDVSNCHQQDVPKVSCVTFIKRLTQIEMEEIQTQNEIKLDKFAQPKKVNKNKSEQHLSHSLLSFDRWRSYREHLQCLESVLFIVKRLRSSNYIVC